MTVETMRTVDRIVGVPLCWLTGIGARLLTRSPLRKDPSQYRTVLVIKMFGMGSVLLAAPFLEELHKRLPGARILFLTFASNKELVERLTVVTDPIVIRTSHFRCFVSDLVRTLAFIRRSHPDAAFDLEFFSKFTTLVSTLSGAPCRSAYELPARWRRWNATHTVPLDISRHISLTFMDQLPWRTAVRVADDRVHFTPSNTEIAEVIARLSLNGATPFAIACININAGPTALERRWPPERFAKVAERYLEKYPETTLYFTGVSSEREYIDDLLERFPQVRKRARNVAGNLSFGEFGALLSLSRWFLSNDSGPIHVASAVGTPVIALFGPESPAIYGPLANGQVLYAGTPCSPCLNVYSAKRVDCPFNAYCMREISVDQVLSEVFKQEQFHLAG